MTRMLAPMSFLRFSIDLSISDQLDDQNGANLDSFFTGFVAISKKRVFWYLIGKLDFLI